MINEIVPVIKGDIIHQQTNFHGTITDIYYWVKDIDVANNTVIFNGINGESGEYPADIIVRKMAGIPHIIYGDSLKTTFERINFSDLPSGIKPSHH